MNFFTNFVTINNSSLFKILLRNYLNYLKMFEFKFDIFVNYLLKTEFKIIKVSKSNEMKPFLHYSAGPVIGPPAYRAI
jgi:hypothetical protein